MTTEEQPARRRPGAPRRLKPEERRIQQNFSLSRVARDRIYAYAAEKGISTGAVLDMLAKKLRLASPSPVSTSINQD